MILPMDPSTGRPTGVPRQLSLDRVRGTPGFQFSPDGSRVSYIEEASNRIKTVPVQGGAATVVYEGQSGTGNVTWSADGRHIYFTEAEPAAGEFVLRRAPAGGGSSEEVFRSPRAFGLTPGGNSPLLAGAAGAAVGAPRPRLRRPPGTGGHPVSRGP
jgi:hypothetical protein